MTSVLSIKWDHQGAFRRFVLNLPANGDLYGALIAKILAVQPDFNDSLAWKDNEGDLIVFTSTTELTEAVNGLKAGEPLRLYTVVNGEKQSSKETVLKSASSVPSAFQPAPPTAPVPTQPLQTAEPAPITKNVDESQAVHVNVGCDGCKQMPLKGIRHKCLLCLDFDLCDTCKTENKHPGHPMARIADPNDRSWMVHFAPFAHRRMGPPPPCWHRHVPQHILELIKQQQKQENPSCPCNPSGEPPKQAPNQSNTADAPSEFNSEKFLNDIGTTVAELLNNFGIDVDVLVEESKKEKTAEQPKNTSTAQENAAGTSEGAKQSPTNEEMAGENLEKMIAQLMTAANNGGLGTILNAFLQQQQQQKQQ